MRISNIFRVIVTMSLLFSVFVPVGTAFADEGDPAPTEEPGGTEGEGSSAPDPTQEPEPTETGESEGEENSTPDLTQEPDPTEASGTEGEETAIPDPTQEPESTETGGTEGEESDTQTSEESIPEEQEEDLSEIVTTLAEAEAVVTNAAGEPVPLVSQEAAEILLNSDPWFIDTNGDTQAYMFDCTGWVPDTPTPGSSCTPSTNPIQDAIDDPDSAGMAIILEFADYSANDIVISNSIILALDSLSDIVVNSITLGSGSSVTYDPTAYSGSWSSYELFAPYVIVQDGASIQQGVEMVSDGGTVQVEAGTYEEEVTIGKPMNLVGDPGDEFKVGPGADAPVLTSPTTPVDDIGIQILNTQLVSVSGFIIQGFNKGIYYNDDGGSASYSAYLRNNKFIDNYLYDIEIYANRQMDIEYSVFMDTTSPAPSPYDSDEDRRIALFMGMNNFWVDAFYNNWQCDETPYQARGLLETSVDGPLAPWAIKSKGKILPLNTNTECQAIVKAFEINSANVKVRIDEGEPFDDEFPPEVSLNKSVDPASRPEPGGSFTYTLTITNPSEIETAEIVTLTDDHDLSTDCLDLIGTFLGTGEGTSCEYDVVYTAVGVYGNTASVTVKDEDGETASDTASATVSVTDNPPSVSLSKSVEPADLPEPGGTFTYTLAITNTSGDTVTISDLQDAHTLSPECLSLIITNVHPGVIIILPHGRIDDFVFAVGPHSCGQGSADERKTFRAQGMRIV